MGQELISTKDIKNYLKLDKEELEKSLNKLLTKYIKKEKRVARIFKQSDKQQFEILKLHEKLEQEHTILNTYKDEIQKLRDYDVQQQQIASAKVEASIINELQNDDVLDFTAIFIPSDILSGDYYSAFKRDDGSIFFYILDGQGHGIPPALTVFSISAIIARYVKEDLKFQELLNTILPYMTDVLADEEQVSFTIVEINPTFTQLNYTNGGMYPMLLKDGDDIIKLKANALPVMDFTQSLQCKSVNISDFKTLVLYSDGLVEEENDEQIKQYSPELLIDNPNLIEDAKKNLPSLTLDDDLTFISISKK